jgi:hypothetical protein
MGHESRIELWSPTGPPFCFAGFGTDRLRREQAMKTAGRENPIHGVTLPRNRAPGAVGQNRSRSIKWAAKQEKFQPLDMCFFLTSTFIELIGRGTRIPSGLPTIRSESLSPLRTDELNHGGPKNECQSTVRRSTPSRATLLVIC